MSRMFLIIAAAGTAIIAATALAQAGARTARVHGLTTAVQLTAKQSFRLSTPLAPGGPAGIAPARPVTGGQFSVYLSELDCEAFGGKVRYNRQCHGTKLMCETKSDGKTYQSCIDEASDD